jgi:membrane protease YdiL (CAAX protease family)
MERDIDSVEVVNPKKNRSGLSKLIGFLLILALCFFVGNVVLVLFAMMGGLSIVEGLDIFAAISDPALRPFIKAGIGFNHLILFTGTSLIFAYWLKRKEWSSYFESISLDVNLLISFILLLVCAYPLIGFSATIFEDVEWASKIDEGSIDALMKMLQMDSVWDLLVNLIIIALLPAIGEELLFRGIIQKELVSRIKNHHVAIVIASIIFSGVHLQIQGFFPKFFIGMILGYAYFWTKSIWYPMILHFINNGMQTLVLFFVGDQMDAIQEEGIKTENSYLVMVVIFSCFLCLLILYMIQRHLEFKRNINI